MDESTLAKIERQRVELEENISKLRKSLRHWQTLEIDYEGLKEEFQGLPNYASHEDCLQRAKDFKPEVVDDKELESLLGNQRQGYKRPPQLVEVLSKRVDYVVRNVSTIRKQLSDAEKKRNVLLLAQDPDHQDEAALPLSEIIEELDEDGRVLSSKVENPGKNAPDLIEVLRKAGVPDLKELNGRSIAETVQSDRTTKSVDIVAPSELSSAHDQLSSPLRNQTSTEEVSESEVDNSSVDGEDSTRGVASLGPTNPEDTEEDAALRQEMLKYGLDEVGAIVAELDLEDAGEYSDEDEPDDYLSDYDEDEDLYTDESEDETGAIKNPVISDRYRRQMESLSRKHGITDLKNLGPEPDLPADAETQLDRPSAAEAARQAALARYEANKSALKSPDKDSQPKKQKKKVGFAPSLDIAQESTEPKVIASREPAVNPVGDTVVERDTSNTIGSATAAPPSTQPPAAKKVSRFKATRTATPATPMFPPPMDFPSPTTSKATPSGPPGQIIAKNLIEQPAAQVTAPADPADFDEELHRKEVAVEYQKLRNRKIHDQGGYVKGGEAENYGEVLAAETVVDENTGKPRKISRFKAARMQS